MSIRGWVATILLPLLAGCAAVTAAPLAALSINQESIAQLKKRYALATAEVDDPVYKRKQQYQGFRLRDLLKGMSYAGHTEDEVYVRFRCKDGYLPIMPLSRALKGDGLVAIRDMHALPGKDWEPVSANGEFSTPAPSYLVWVAPPGGTEEYPWPYQMTAIELVSATDALGGLAPDGPKKAGYDLFVTHCLKCHAINGVGGTFGPELNSPCSVTEYWNPSFLSRFIANAGSVRAGSRMPGFQSLPSSDIQAIIEYLQYMASHKKTGGACR
jgi:mono/diheme cytochrome c family protein